MAKQDSDHPHRQKMQTAPDFHLSIKTISEHLL